MKTLIFPACLPANATATCAAIRQRRWIVAGCRKLIKIRVKSLRAEHFAETQCRTNEEPWLAVNSETLLIVNSISLFRS